MPSELAGMPISSARYEAIGRATAVAAWSSRARPASRPRNQVAPASGRRIRPTVGDEVGQAIEELGIRGARAQHELVDAHRALPVEELAEGGRGRRDALEATLGERRIERVRGPDVVGRLGVGVGAQRDVARAQPARPAAPAGGRPGGLDVGPQGGHPRRLAAARRHEAVAPGRDPARDRRHVAADEQLRAVRGGWRRSRWGPARPAHPAVRPPTAGAGWAAVRRAAGRAARRPCPSPGSRRAGCRPRRRATDGHRDRAWSDARLAGEQGRLAGRGQDDAREQANPAGHARDGGQSDERLVGQD